MTATREEWLAERKSGIGGSEAAAILGLSPFATPMTVWMDKTGRGQPKEETEAMMLGTELEDFVARRYTMKTGRKVQRHNRMIHDGCLLGNVDRLVVPDGAKIAAHMGEIRTDTLLECKTSSRAWDEGVPLYYETQVQHYMGLCPMIGHADVACLFIAPAKKFEVYRVERDQKVIDFMQWRLREWWKEYVEADVCPPPSNEEDCKRMFARSNPGKTVDATYDINERVKELAEVNAKIKALEGDAQRMRDEVCAFMGDAETLAGFDGKPIVTWKSAKDSRRTDWQAVAREAGADVNLIDLHTKSVPGSRRFIVK